MKQDKQDALRPGFSSRCTVCKSPRRVEIDQRLLAGESVRSVVQWLIDNGEQISKTAIGNHKLEHLAVAEAIAERAAASQPAFDAAVQSGLDRLAELEANARCMIRVRDAAADATVEQTGKGFVDKGLAQVVVAAASEVRQSIQAIQKTLGEEAQQQAAAPPDGSATGLEELSDEELKIILRLTSKAQSEGSTGPPQEG